MFWDTASSVYDVFEAAGNRNVFIGAKGKKSLNRSMEQILSWSVRAEREQ